MAERKNRNLYVVGEPEERMDKSVNMIVGKPGGEDGVLPEEADEPDGRKRKKKRGRKIWIAAVSALAALFALFLLVQLQTYSSVQVSDVYSSNGADSGSYSQFAGGALKYSRDGISYLNQKGEEQWNQPYQIKSPFVEVNSVSGAVADKGGNDIYVFREDGIKGEIHTTMPIQKLAVSEQGIVCAILKDEDTPRIICYDTAGNILVEHKTSLTGTGYPLDVSISPDGEIMQAVYLYTQSGKIVSRVAYYNFGEEGEGKTDHQVTYQEYEGAVMAQGFFLSEDASVVIGDGQMAVYKGKDVPEEIQTVKIDKEIKSAFHNGKYVGMVLKNEGKGGYELRLYNASGKQVMSKDFTGDYSNIKLYGSQVVMYDGQRCAIFMRSGVMRFQGEMDGQILEIFPVMGVNKYIVINANGIEHIRLVK